MPLLVHAIWLLYRMKSVTLYGVCQHIVSTCDCHVELNIFLLTYLLIPVFSEPNRVPKLRPVTAFDVCIKYMKNAWPIAYMVYRLIRLIDWAWCIEAVTLTQIFRLTLYNATLEWQHICKYIHNSANKSLYFGHYARRRYGYDGVLIGNLCVLSTGDIPVTFAELYWPFYPIYLT